MEVNYSTTARAFVGILKKKQKKNYTNTLIEWFITLSDDKMEYYLQNHSSMFSNCTLPSETLLLPN